MGTRHINQSIRITFSCKNTEPKKEIKKAIPFPKHQKLKYLNLMHKNYTLKAAKIIEIEKLYQQKVTQM